MEAFNGLWFDDEHHTSNTAQEQVDCERQCSHFLIKNKQQDLQLDKEAHINYIYSGLRTLPAGFVSLDASRPWIVYWCLHALILLGETVSSLETQRIIDTLNTIQNSTSSPKPLLKNAPPRFMSGGFGGSTYQLSHWYGNHPIYCCIV